MSSYRILVVEDEMVTALDLRLTLEELGHEVLATCGSGERALVLAPALLPDLILMDIQLDGELRGTEAAALIHQQTQTPILFLSAYTDDQSLEEACQSLAYGYLVKPFDKREVAAAIRVAMNRAGYDQRLRASEERLRLALDAGRMRIWEWQSSQLAMADPVNTSDTRSFSLGFDELMALIHEDDRDQLRAQLLAHSRFRKLIRLRQPDGQYRWHHLMASLLSSGTVGARVLGVLHDVHDDHEARARLQQAEVVFNATREGILVTDAGFRIIRVNPAFVAITGHPAESVMGKLPDQILYARRQGDSPLMPAAGTDCWSGEVACQRANGDVFPAWQHISCIRNQNGERSGFIINIADITALRRAEKRLEQLAFVDSLTGLANRVQLERCLGVALATCNEQQRLALIYMDLDGFKRVNDTLGHAEGDLLLIEVAERLRHVLRESDVIARVGGDEFVIMLEQLAPPVSLEKIAAKILRAICRPVALANDLVQVSGSLGIVVATSPARTQESLLKAADAAMFEAKKQGKQTWCFYDAELDRELNQRMEIESALPVALENGQFLLGYQPLLSAGGHRICGVEALIRWQHPELGLLMPDRFIGVAEQTRHINEIGYWVLKEACRTLRDWEAMGLTGLTMSVNVSPRQMSDRAFPERIGGLIREFAINADQLELEITETALHGSEALTPQLEAIRRLGVHLAIDDFGTGYSSLSRLKELPFDRVKIDRSFIRDLPDSSDDVEICRAIMALCKVLGLKVTAEGIETPSQRDLLESMGCDVLQGFLFSQALGSGLLPEWVAGQKH